MKRILSIALALAMITGALAMVSCSKEEGNTTTAGTTTKASDKTTAPNADPTTPAPATTDELTITEVTEYTNFVVGDEEITTLVGSSVNLMDGFFVKESGFNVDLSFAPTTHEGEGPELLFDGSEQTKWCTERDKIEWCSAVVWSMTQPVTATHYVFQTANDNAKYPGRNPVSWRIYGTNKDLDESMKMTDDNFDNDTVPEGWELITRVQMCLTMPDVDYTNIGFPIEGNTKAYKNYMLLFEQIGTSGTFQMSEVKLYGTAG